MIIKTLQDKEGNVLIPRTKFNAVTDDNNVTLGTKFQDYRTSTNQDTIDQGLSAATTQVSNTLTSHKENVDNPHAVTKAQVGLGNVDNTSDVDKPISTATQTALDKKIETEDSTLTEAMPINADTLENHAASYFATADFVAANPTLSGSETSLTGIKIGETKYKVEASGGTDEALESAKENGGIGWKVDATTITWDGDTTGKTKIEDYDDGVDVYLLSTSIPSTVDKFIGQTVKINYNGTEYTTTIDEDDIENYGSLAHIFVHIEPGSCDVGMYLPNDREESGETFPKGLYLAKGSDEDNPYYISEISFSKSVYQIEPEFINADGGIGWNEFSAQTWDGDREGKTKITYDRQDYYLISATTPPTIDKFVSGYLKYVMFGSEVSLGPITSEDIEQIETNAYIIQAVVISYGSTTFPTAGFYFMYSSDFNAYACSISYISTVHKVTPAYIQGSSTANQVLTSDASGNVSWQNPSGSSGVTDVKFDGTSVVTNNVANLYTDEALDSAKTTGGIGWQTTYQSPEWDGDITGKTPVVVRGGTKYYLGSTSIVNLPSEVTSSDTWNCTLTMHDVVSGLAISPLEDHPTSYGPDGDSSFVMVIMPDELFTEVGTYLMKFSIEGTTVYVSEVKVGTLTVTWDGDTTGKTSVECGDYTYYKITNEAVSSPTQYTADIKTAATTYDELYVTPGDGACAFVCDTGGFLFTNKDNATITSQSVTYTFPTAGVYYTAQYSSGEGMYFSKVILDPISNKINSSYISSGSATSGYVLTADGSGSTSWAAAPGASGAVFSINAVRDTTAATLTVDKTYAQLLAAYNAGNIISTTVQLVYTLEEGGDIWFRDTDCVKAEVRSEESPYGLLGYEFNIGLRGTRGLPNRGCYLTCDYQDGWAFHTYE